MPRLRTGMLAGECAADAVLGKSEVSEAAAG